VGRYLARRIILLIPVWLAVYTAVFLLFQITPGGPWDKEKPVPREALEALNQRYGLDKPAWQQYVDYLVGVVTRFDFGPSYKRVSRTVSDIIQDFFPVSATIGGLAMLFAVSLGVPLGVIAATRHNSAADFGAMFVGVVGISIPSFVVGPILIWVFALVLGWVPTGGVDQPRNYVLPAVTLGLAPLALIARFTRSTMLDVLRTDYVRTARAKGLVEWVVVSRHALRNGLIPLVTVIGFILAEVIVGSFYVETVFVIPGIGRYFVTSVTDRDFPVLMGITLLLASSVAVANLIVDVLYAYLDPRIRYR
jgi:oligopeptide transport system permease protein